MKGFDISAIFYFSGNFDFRVRAKVLFIALKTTIRQADVLNFKCMFSIFIKKKGISMPLSDCNIPLEHNGACLDHPATDGATARTAQKDVHTTRGRTPETRSQRLRIEKLEEGIISGRLA